MNQKKKSVIFTVLLIAASTSVAILLTEVLLWQIFPPAHSWKFPQEEYQFDPEIGYRLKENQRAYTHDEAVSVNSHGLRDREYAERPMTGTIRVLALGDSQTFGNGLAISNTWPKQLEQVLNDRFAGNQWEIVNAGLPASDTWQHEILLRRLAPIYHPAVVVLAFYVNDVSESFVPKPSVTNITNTFSKRIAYALRGSVLVLLAHNAVDRLRMRWSPGTNSVHENAVVNGLPLPSASRAWRQVELSLTAMQKYAMDHKATFIIAVLPRRDMVASVSDTFAYNTQIHAIADRHHIEFIDMMPPLRQTYQNAGTTLFIPWDGHNSAVANRVIANELGNLLQKTIHDTKFRVARTAP